MSYTREEHQQEHDSQHDPRPDCEHCRREVFRRTHRCFGDGTSSVPVPQKTEA
jgi:hypothetical protein